MWSPKFLLPLALGLLPSLTIASKCSNDVATIERLPVFATSDGPFVLRVQDGFNVFIKEDKVHHAYVLYLSKKNEDLPEFELLHGNLTTADKKLAGFYPPVPLIYPPVLFPLLLSGRVGGRDGADIVIVTKTRSDGSGREIRRLFPLNGRELLQAAFAWKRRSWNDRKQKLIWDFHSARGYKAG